MIDGLPISYNLDYILTNTSNSKSGILLVSEYVAFIILRILKIRTSYLPNFNLKYKKYN